MRLSFHRPKARASLAPLVGLLLLATATACGGDDGGGDGVASAGGDDTIVDDDSDDGGDGGTGGGGGKEPQEDTRLEFAKCMRENGVEEYPDPDPNGRTFTMKSPEEYGVDEETMQKAMDACKEFMPGGGEPPKLTADDIEKMNEFAECMRGEGIDMPDPNSNGSLSMPEDVKPDSAEFEDAMKACRDIIDGLPLMMQGGPGPGGDK